MKPILLLISLLFLASCSGLLKNAHAPISITGYWAVMSQNNNIYTTAYPMATKGEIKGRSLHYLLVNRNSLSNQLVVSLVGGKNYKEGSSVIIKVNYNEYYLPVYEDRAWLTSQEQVSELISDIQKSSTLTVINQFYDNSEATDTYDLSGFNQSYQNIIK